MNRFAPSTTGRAHPGTLLAALLCWLDARARGGRVLLRLEDLDPQRCTEAFRLGLEDDLAWLGLDWDLVERQGAHGARHAAALDRLAAAGLLYPCSCGRSRLRDLGRRGPDGGFAYDNACRQRQLAGDWRDSPEAIRLRIDHPVAVHDLGGEDLGMDVAAALGDPVLRRRDGAVAYHLASVVDDAACGVEHVVRGRDLASATATQVAIQRALELPTPSYRHHLLLLEEHGGKLAKLHGAVAADQLRRHFTPSALCGLLARVAGLRPDAAPVTPRELVADFDWQQVRPEDQVLRWAEPDLEWLGAA